NSKLSNILPKDDKTLFCLLEKRHDNSLTNDLVRLGRVIHYENSPDDSNGVSLGATGKIWKMSMADLANSTYWTSNGQSEIKRTEAFVRVWRNSISQGARSARAFADPEGTAKDKDANGREIPGDITIQSVSLALAKDPDSHDNAAKQAGILFGRNAKLFTESEVSTDSFIYTTLRLLASVRNQGFHFKGRRTFVQSMKRDLSQYGDILRLDKDDTSWKTTLEAIRQLLRDDEAQQQRRLYDVCEAAHLHRFANKDELDTFLTFVGNNTNPDFVLPKFNRLLLRVENTELNMLPRAAGRLPGPASKIDMKDKASLARFVALRLIYQHSFGEWVKKISTGDLSKYLDAAIKRGTREAKSINDTDEFNDLIVAKPEELRSLPAGSIQEYMDALQAYQASDMRIQRGYESDREKAKKQSEWIENFRCDIIARAFGAFLANNRIKFGWLLNLKPEKVPADNTVFPLTPSEDESTEREDWLAVIYYVMHLVPVDDVSRLLHQFKKWGILEVKAAEGGEHPIDSDVESLKTILTLYLDMHDDKHTGEGIENRGLELFHDMFEGGRNVFNQVFSTEGSDDQQLATTR
ncbi:MAG: hypothetical protein GY761_11455, partial [Hyphomicrobiales bacterium]|nr:hypothetical protein [Hyphomicrobiales bacterium]